MTKINAFVFSLALAQFSLAQNEDDVLRYSQNYFGGTARNISTAGAFSALGGDYSTALINPASLARFKKQNFSFTQLIENPKIESDFYGNLTEQKKLAYKFSNISYVKVYNLDPRIFSNWYGVTLSMGYNRIQSFEENIAYTGTVDSSILHSFIKQAEGVNPDFIYDVFPFDVGLAYDTYALDPGPNNTYITDFTSGTATHTRSIRRTGGMGEFNFALSGNYANKLFIGGSLNFTRVKYGESMEHTEVFSDSSLWIRDIQFLNELQIEGWGKGLRLGVIYLPLDWIRIGVAVQSPTYYNLSDKWNAKFFTNTDDGLKFVNEENIPFGSFDYRLRTPIRANVSLGIVLKKLGSIGMNIEFVDYSKGLLSAAKNESSPYLFLAENAQVGNIYRSVFNFSLGVEYRIKSQYYVRGGFANYGSPYKKTSGNNLYPTQFFTGGFGYNYGSFYIDLAAQFKFSRSDYFSYDPAINGSYAVFHQKNLNYLISVGFRFD